MPTILVGDSDRGTNADLCAALEKIGYQHLSAFTGDEVIYFASRNITEDEDPISLIIMDVNIRGLTGYHVVKRLVSLGMVGRIPMVLTVDRYLRDQYADGFSAGVFGFIVKPINPRRVAVTLKAIVEGDTAKLRKAAHSHDEKADIITPPGNIPKQR